MQYIRVQLESGFELLMPFDGENYYWPFCGLSHGDYPPYYDSYPSHDSICPDCMVQPGCDDTGGNGIAQEQYVAAYRRRWLSENEWDPVRVERLCAVFQLTDDDVEMIRHAAVLK